MSRRWVLQPYFWISCIFFILCRCPLTGSELSTLRSSSSVVSLRQDEWQEGLVGLQEEIKADCQPGTEVNRTHTTDIAAPDPQTHQLSPELDPTATDALQEAAQLPPGDAVLKEVWQRIFYFIFKVLNTTNTALSYQFLLYIFINDNNTSNCNKNKKGQTCRLTAEVSAFTPAACCKPPTLQLLHCPPLLADCFTHTRTHTFAHTHAHRTGLGRSNRFTALQLLGLLCLWTEAWDFRLNVLFYSKAPVWLHVTFILTEKLSQNVVQHKRVK